jgi:hypothetical protein
MNQKLLKKICHEDIIVFSGVVHNAGEWELCSTAENLDDEILEIVEAHMKELGLEPSNMLFSGVADKVARAPGAYDEEENPLFISAFYHKSYKGE